MTTALVVGAGLGGLMAATRLAEAGLDVTILESSNRAGGKAGSYTIDGKLYDHGWHGFPGWYLNMFELLEKLNVKLVGFEASIFVKSGPGGGLDHPTVLNLPTSLSGLIKLITGGFMPPADMVLYLYYLLDTLAMDLSNKQELDRISRTAMMHGKWYVNPELVAADSDSLLKGTAIPAYEMSAITWNTVLGNWAKSPQPFMSVLPGPMQSTFIDPFVAYAKSKGVKIVFNEKVLSFKAAPGKMESLTSVDTAGVQTVRKADYFVMGAPVESARTFFQWDAQSQDPKIGEMQHLMVIPMGSLHIKLKTKLPNVPKGPIFFKGGRYALSFVDMSQLGPTPGPVTELSFVTSNNVELLNLSTQDQYTAMMGEVTEFIGIKPEDVDSWQVISNVAAPLSVNDVGAWPRRPGVRAKDLPNMVYACDWAKTPVDLCCMEGALSAAMHATHEIGKDLGKDLPMPQVAPQYPRWLYKLATIVLFPVVPIAWLFSLRSRDPQP